MSNGIHAKDDYDIRLNPLNRVVAVLQRQCLDTAELLSHVDHARLMIEGPNAPPIRTLLTGLRGELAAGRELLQERIRSLSPGRAQPQRAETDSQSFWRLFRTDGGDCSAHVEALLSGFLHYARATSDSVVFLQMLGDEESVKLVKAMFDVADRSIVFLELYFEGLALHMELRPISPAVGPATSRNPE